MPDRHAHVRAGQGRHCLTINGDSSEARAAVRGSRGAEFVTYPQPWQLTNKGTWPKSGRASEEQLTGVSYVHGGGRWESTGAWDGPRQVVGYALQFQGLRIKAD